tara:strand:- start:123 stop:347 length:225 start_codon:yes stop_codon:yes gene_type:complete
MIICAPEDCIKENIAAEATGPDEPYVVVEVALTPAEAQEMVDTLESNGSSARATRDPLSRAVLEAIKDSGILGG